MQYAWGICDRSCLCHKISLVWHLPDQKIPGKVLMTPSFCTYIHVDVVNVIVNCCFTPVRALLPFLCSYLCAPSGLRGVVILTCHASSLCIIIALQDYSGYRLCMQCRTPATAVYSIAARSYSTLKVNAQCTHGMCSLEL